MIALPVAIRELRLASRHRLTYIERIWTGLLALIGVGWLMWSIAHFGGAIARGTQLFYWVAGILYAQAILGGVVRTCDCLSSEKREGTLGLLFLTHLRSFEIVFGKLAAHAVKPICTLLVTFPFVTLATLWGGVSAGQLLRVAITLSSGLFLALAIGIFTSAVCMGYAKSSNLAVTLVILIWLFPPGTAWVGRHYFSAPAFFFGLMLVSPYYSQHMAFGSSWSLSISGFWSSLLLTTVLTIGFLTAAIWILPNSWQQKVDKTGKRKIARRQDFKRRATKLDRNPIFWLASLSRLRARKIFVDLGLLSLIAACINGQYVPAGNEGFIWLFVAAIIHIDLKSHLSAASSERFAQDKESGAFEMLLSTPLSVGEIIGGHCMALVRQFRWPIVAVLLLDIWTFHQLIPGLRRLDELFFDSEKATAHFLSSFCYWTFGFHALVQLSDLIALGWNGMWNGVCKNSPQEARAHTFMQVMIPPVLFFGLIATVFVHGVFRHLAPSQSFACLLALWVGLNLANDLFLFLRARARLFQELRVQVTQRFQPPAPTSQASSRILTPIFRLKPS